MKRAPRRRIIHHRSPEAIVFEVGAEGGSLAVEESIVDGTRIFIVSLDESALNDLLDEDDEPLAPFEVGRALTFEDALVMMDVYGWHHLFPCIIAEHVRDAVTRAFLARIEGHVVKERIHLDAWRRLLHRSQ
jgi:hypothetical protein